MSLYSPVSSRIFAATALLMAFATGCAVGNATVAPQDSAPISRHVAR